MMREDVEHHQSIFHSATGRNFVTEYYLLAIVMRAWIEEERAGRALHGLAQSSVALTGVRHDRGNCGSAAARLKDGPTGKATRHFLHVLLRVATIDSERVQLHQLARVVLVDTASLLLLRPETTGSAGVRSNALKVVEVEQHRRTLRRRFEQIGELRQRVGTNRVAIVRSQQPAIGALVSEDVEVVGPEVDHYFLKLSFAVNRAQDSGRL